MIEEFGLKTFIFSFGFLFVILFFAFELPYLQHIIKLWNFILIFGVPGIFIGLYFSWDAAKQENIRGRIAYTGMSLILSFLFILSLASFINRSFLDETSTKIPVYRINVEYNTMFGLIEQIDEKVEPTHIRIMFEYSGKRYSRAFRSKKVFIGRESNNDIYITTKKGLLTFAIVSL